MLKTFFPLRSLRPFCGEFYLCPQHEMHPRCEACMTPIGLLRYNRAGVFEQDIVLWGAEEGIRTCPDA